jgi:hypothetical protein
MDLPIINNNNQDESLGIVVSNFEQLQNAVIEGNIAIVRSISAMHETLEGMLTLEQAALDEARRQRGFDLEKYREEQRKAKGTNSDSNSPSNATPKKDGSDGLFKSILAAMTIGTLGGTLGKMLKGLFLGGFGLITKSVTSVFPSIIKAIQGLFTRGALLKILGKVFTPLLIIGSVAHAITGALTSWSEDTEAGLGLREKVVNAVSAGLGGIVEFLTFGLIKKDDVTGLLAPLNGWFTDLGVWIDDLIASPQEALKTASDAFVKIETFLNDQMGKLWEILGLDDLSKALTGVKLTGEDISKFLTDFTITPHEIVAWLGDQAKAIRDWAWKVDEDGKRTLFGINVPTGAEILKSITAPIINLSEAIGNFLQKQYTSIKNWVWSEKDGEQYLFGFKVPTWEQIGSELLNLVKQHPTVQIGSWLGDQTKKIMDWVWSTKDGEQYLFGFKLPTWDQISDKLDKATPDLAEMISSTLSSLITDLSTFMKDLIPSWSAIKSKILSSIPTDFLDTYVGRKTLGEDFTKKELARRQLEADEVSTPITRSEKALKALGGDSIGKGIGATVHDNSIAVAKGGDSNVSHIQNTYSNRSAISYGGGRDFGADDGF